MISLYRKGKSANVTETIVGKIHIVDDSTYHVLDVNLKIKAKLTLTESNASEDVPSVNKINNFKDLQQDDVVAVNTNGRINTIFQIGSTSNSLFITDRCNSNCLMCSQPPKNIDDLDFHYQINSQLIEFIPSATEEIGITGGEPTILGERLYKLIDKINYKNSSTLVHILTNGRSYTNTEEARKISERQCQLGIPLYSDFYADHDYIVQAKGAFNQTVTGLMNLARYGQSIEIRIVLHKLSVVRLVELSHFIYKNLPFVDHIAFMGLEYTGYTPHNHELLWIEPSMFSSQLEESVLFLSEAGFNVSIYNLQFCLLPRTLWEYAKRSISEWKRESLDECNKCKMKKDCGGVFGTSRIYSNEIIAIY